MKKRKITVYLMIISVLMVSVLFMGASCSSTTANVSNAVMTTGIDDNYAPIDNVTDFAVNTDVYVAADLKNAPDDTNITFIWYYEGQQLATKTISSGEVSDAPLAGYLPADFMSQPGNYSVEIYIDDRDKPDTVNQYTVK